MIYNFEKLNFQILTIDKFTHIPGNYKTTGRPFASLSIRLSGTGKFRLKDKEFVSGVGDVTFFCENAQYSVEYSGGECIAVHLSDCNYRECENIKTKTGPYLTEKFNELLKIKDDLEKTNEKKALIYEILQILSDSKNESDSDEDLKKCILYINENYKNTKMSMGDVCKNANISESTLRRKFRSHYGMSPKKYLIEIRLSKAVKLLVTGKKSVKETAFECGFDDEKYFSKMIKKRFNLSPSDFKKGI